ncbi:unnamed protein product [Clonostachys rhizophaga]|uniref:Heterokaryon incompatibility domain-containing protein n=1 Tax=Clonostachys rhizophaga TaxID=160324 RepID=A0A9N9YBF7_9HYPO|nr:unnamed protein product [Clonostachys rhizophaga]
MQESSSSNRDRATAMSSSSDWVVPEIPAIQPPRTRRMSTKRAPYPAKRQQAPIVQYAENDELPRPPSARPPSAQRASWHAAGPPAPYYDSRLAIPFHPSPYPPSDQAYSAPPFDDERETEGNWNGWNAQPYDNPAAHAADGPAASRYPRSPPDEPAANYPDSRRLNDQITRSYRGGRLEDSRPPLTRPQSARPPREPWQVPQDSQFQRPKNRDRSFSVEDRARNQPQEAAFDSVSRHAASRISNTSSMQTSTGETQFQYRPITGTEFRLLRLLPASMSTIKCEILHASLDTDPEIQKYTAISYAWGDIEPNMKIEVDRCSVLITPSLHGALKRLRQQDKSIMVWADALCIDQKNKAEQSQQISMMTSIYGGAESVAVWLGDSGDNSDLAIDLIQGVFNSDNDGAVSRIISAEGFTAHFTALVKLFEREFWDRLWVVQEILNAQMVTVYCGNSSVSWEVLQGASIIFQQHEKDLRIQFPRGKTKGSRRGLSYAHVLSSCGPASLELLRVSPEEEIISLLSVLRVCRPKLAAEPRDKVFGVLGILPAETSFHFPPNYGSSLREVYTNVVDLILHTTRRLDVICEAIYFPVYTSSVKLPSWVPDWSHIPSTAGLGTSYGFNAASEVDAEFQFMDAPHRSLLRISAIYLDQVDMRGVAVGTFCSVDDYLMAFLHWRAKLLSRYSSSEGKTYNMKEDRRSVLSHSMSRAGALSKSPPLLDGDFELEKYLFIDQELAPETCRMLIQENCASRMEGRCFFTTKRGLMGIGSGFMKDGDIICVPLGCKTPIIIRPEADSNQYRLIGDAYVDKYMDGKAVKEWKSDRKKLISYVLQ